MTTPTDPDRSHTVWWTELDSSSEETGPRYYRLHCQWAGCDWTALVPQGQLQTTVRAHERRSGALRTVEGPGAPGGAARPPGAILARLVALLALMVVLALALFLTWMAGAAW